MKAAIFDMDGTLVDSMYYWRTVSLELLRAKGIEPPRELCDRAAPLCRCAMRLNRSGSITNFPIPRKNTTIRSIP